MMKKRLAALFLASVMVCSMVGCGTKDNGDDKQDVTGNQTEQGDENSGNSENGDDTFVVGFDAEFPPYGFMDENGEYTGFDLDLAQEVCNRNGWTLVKQPIDWDSKDMELSAGSIDCIWNGFTMNGRENEYTFTKPYVDNSIVVAVAADSEIATLEDLAGKVVAVQTDSSGLAALQGEDASEENVALTATFAELQQIADYNTAFMNLEAGAVDAIVLDIGVAKYQLANNPEKYKMLDAQVSTEQYAVGFKLGNTELCDKVQATLDEMAADGTLAQIAEKYADYNLPDMLCIGE